MIGIIEVYCKDGSVYKGFLKNRLYHGNGSLFKDLNTLIYEGEWENGRMARR